MVKIIILPHRPGLFSLSITAASWRASASSAPWLWKKSLFALGHVEHCFLALAKSQFILVHIWWVWLGCAQLKKRTFNVLMFLSWELISFSDISCIVCSVQSYREFQQDLFPDTFDGLPLLHSEEWFSGKLATLVCCSHNLTLLSALIWHTMQTFPFCRFSRIGLSMSQIFKEIFEDCWNTSFTGC